MLRLINPAHSDLSDPQLALTADFAAAEMSGQIGYLRNGARENLDQWSGLAIDGGGAFSGDGINGTVVREEFRVCSNWQRTNQIGAPRHWRGIAVVGTVTTEDVTGVYHAEKQ
ncbi:MAG: hypothetical protein F4X91_10520 [Nitrospinae bacterium]|nr:hypothetical protein [Nitrospinota bacterium]